MTGTNGEPEPEIANEDWELPGLNGAGISKSCCVKNGEELKIPGGHGATDASSMGSDPHAEKTETSVVASKIKELVGKQEFRCALSGVPLTPDVASLDHIVPLKNGGVHCMENLQVLHYEVNRMKGSLSQKEFLEWCHLLANAKADASK